MQTASSANRTCSEFRSASLYTATVRMPISLHALITRSAISPRLAINTLRNINPDAFHRTFANESPSQTALPRPDGEQRLPVLHRLSAGSDPLHYLTGDISLNLIHQLHRLDDAKHLPHL